MSRGSIEALLERAGTTYAEDAGIRLADTPAPLYRLLVLSVLLSTRIKADIAVAAAAELARSGMGTPARMRAASWQDRVDALGRAHYKRYDESMATALGEGADLLRAEYRDDLRSLRKRAERDPARIRELLTAFPRLGPVGAGIFCREAQAVWPELRPSLDGKALDGAKRLRLPTRPDELARLVRPAQLAALASALVRVALDKTLAAELTGVGKADKLAAYRDKRNPDKTDEPTGGGSRRGAPRFVIQRHDASSLHFDVRIEVDGVLVSWAVPKGPSTDPREKRLAERTEDHPLDYAEYEGRIAEGEYGAGTVIVWDTGTYDNLDECSVADGLERGHVKVWLRGEKLNGGYVFQHTKMRGDEQAWLMIKVDDEGADRRRKPATTQPESVLSGRRNEDL
jgi:DNA ligase D-like protein (predicted 3'-phosphoesterase)